MTDVRDTPARQVAPARPGHVAAAMLVLAVAYALVAWLGDARVGSYSDVGGRVATAAVLADRGGWDPDLGYWAAAADPAGTAYPIELAEPVGDRWLGAKSQLLGWVAGRLWAVGGADLAIVVVAATASLAALGAMGLSRWATGAAGAGRGAGVSGGPGGTGWAAFWCVGLASPVAFYATDLWEHAPATGMALVALSLLAAGRPGAAGGLGGIAVVLRPEAAIGLAAIGAAVVVGPVAGAAVLAAWRRLVGTVGRAALAAALVVGVVGVLERAVVGSARGAGNATGATAAAGSEVAARLRDAALTTFGLFPSSTGAALTLGAAYALGLVVLARYAFGRGGAVGAWAAAGVCTVAVVLRLGSGWGAVPGLVAACPLVVAGAVGARPGRERALVWAAGATTLAVFAMQWVGSHEGQWGGRYLLVPGAVMVVVAAGRLRSWRWGAAPVAVLAALTVAAPLAGAAWHVHRTRAVAATAAATLADGDRVVVFDLPWLGREAGAWYPGSRWLRARFAPGVPGALDVARRMGVDRLDLVLLGPGDDPEWQGQGFLDEALAGRGWRLVAGSGRVVDFLGYPLAVSTYERPNVRSSG